jgi:hypothetical protein
MAEAEMQRLSFGTAAALIQGCILLVPFGPERELPIGEQVFGRRKGRHPSPILKPRVPADMVDMQMRANVSHTRRLDVSSLMNLAAVFCETDLF